MSLDPERLSRAQSLFQEALDRREADRRRFLEEACGQDRALFDRVLALIEEDARQDGVLDRGVAPLAGALIDVPGSTPAEIGPYRILRVLGKGGMGVVYLGERDDVGGRAAIKVLRDASLSPARRERFASEERTLAQFNHPSIARLYDADVLSDGTPYFVMEYVDGQPLTEFCDRAGLGLRDRLDLFRSVCEAVEFAHRRAVVHRDLKPSNIFVTSDGTPKLLDFGIAKQLDHVESTADPTRTELRMMTPAYAAPEQILGEPVGVFTDVYALGVILYELLTGMQPFDVGNRTPGQLEAKILDPDARRPSTATRATTAKGIPTGAERAPSWADLDVLCTTAMHREAGRRYPTVAALIRDVDHYLLSQPLDARPDSVTYRLGKFVRRNRGRVAVAALTAATIVGVVATYTVRLRTARDAAVAQAARTERIQQFTLGLLAGGDETAGPADSLRVVTLIDRGVQEAAALEGEPEIQAQLFQTLGTIYQQLGQLERADSLLRVSLELRRSGLGPDHPDVAESLVALGVLRLDQALLDEAEAYAVEARDHARRTLPEEHPVIAGATLALGRVLQSRGDYVEAIDLLEEAARLQGARGSQAELSDALGELANTHYYAGNLTESDSLNRRVIEMDRSLYGERHPTVGDALINLGAIQFQRGNYPESEEYYREALDIFEGYYGPDHSETSGGLTMVGQSLVYQDRYDEGLGMLRRALTIRERIYGPDHPQVAHVLNELGTVAILTDDLGSAQQHFRRITDIYRTAHGERHYFVAIALSNQASVHLSAGEFAQAEAMYLDVVERFTEARGADDSATGIARIKLGRALLGQERFAEAEKELMVGYEVMSREANPAVSWLQSARLALVEVYEATGDEGRAEQFRSEWEEAGGTGP